MSTSQQDQNDSQDGSKLAQEDVEYYDANQEIKDQYCKLENLIGKLDKPTSKKIMTESQRMEEALLERSRGYHTNQRNGATCGIQGAILTKTQQQLSRCQSAVMCSSARSKKNQNILIGNLIQTQRDKVDKFVRKNNKIVHKYLKTPDKIKAQLTQNHHHNQMPSSILIKKGYKTHIPSNDNMNTKQDFVIKVYNIEKDGEDGMLIGNEKKANSRNSVAFLQTNDDNSTKLVTENTIDYVQQIESVSRGGTTNTTSNLLCQQQYFTNNNQSSATLTARASTQNFSQTKNHYKKRSCAVILDQNTELREPVLEPYEIMRIFNAKTKDLKISYFENQYQRFVDYCNKYCQNRKLYLSEMGLSYFSARVISQLILTNVNLCKVSLPGNQLGDIGAQMFAQVLPKSSQLISLDLSSNSISGDGAAAIFESLAYNQSLQELNFSSKEGGLNRNCLGHVGVKPLASILSFNQFLVILDLSGNFIGDKGLSYICEGLLGGPNETLTKLNLSMNDITFVGCAQLQNTLPETKLKYLNLSLNPIKNKGAKHIGDMLFKGGLLLEKLNLTSCEIQNMGALFIYQGVRRAGKLRTLILDKNDLQGKSLSDLQQMLTQHGGLKKLSMDSCHIQDEGTCYIMDGLERNFILQHLNLRNNQINYNGAKRIAELLTTNNLSAIVSLNLSMNSLGEKGGIMIAEALVKNGNIKTVVLKDTDIRDECVKKIAYALKENKNLKNLNIDWNIFNPRHNTEIEKFTRQNRQHAANMRNSVFRDEIVQLMKLQETKPQLKGEKEQLIVQKDKMIQKYRASNQQFDELQEYDVAHYEGLKVKCGEQAAENVEMDQRVNAMDQKIIERNAQINKSLRAEIKSIFNLQKGMELTNEQIRELRTELGQLKFEQNEQRAKFQKVATDYKGKLLLSVMSYNSLKSSLVQDVSAIQQQSQEQNQNVDPSHQPDQQELELRVKDSSPPKRRRDKSNKKDGKEAANTNSVSPRKKSGSKKQKITVKLKQIK